MATSVPPPADVTGDPSGTASRPSATSQPLTWVRIALVVAWLGLAMITGLTGERESNLEELRSAAASGDVDVVEVAGLLPPGTAGRTTAELRWTDGWIDHYTEVAHLVRPRGDRSGTTVKNDPTDLVRKMGAEVRIDPGPRDTAGGMLHVWGWRTSLEVGAGWLVVTLSRLVLLFVGPEPWRATRAAWMALMVVLPPLGSLAYLFLSGPPAPTPRPDAGRLTGGWALLLSILALSAFGSSFT